MNESNKGAATFPPPPPPTIEEKKSWADWATGVGGPLIGLVLLCVIFSLTSDVFLTWRNALNVIDQITVLGILAIGMTAVIVIGGIDLSVGSILAFSMMMMGWLYHLLECRSGWLSLRAFWSAPPAASLTDFSLDATMTQKTQGMGKLALESALDLAAGKEVPKEQLQEAVLMTKENVGPFIKQHP